MSGRASWLPAVLRSVYIQSTNAFSLSGPPAGTDDPGGAEPEAVQRLVGALRDRLYEAAFTRPFGSPPRAARAAPDDLVERLRAANHGQDIWTPGWRVERIDAAGDIVAREGQRVREVPAGDYAPLFAEDVRPCPGSPVLVRFPRESLRMQRGYYYAFGSALPSAEDEQRAVRLYLAAPQSDVPVLFDALTRALGDERAPFTLKTVLHPADAARLDATVLYVPRRLFGAARRAVAAIPEAVRARLGPGVPLFSKPLCPGVGAAEHPGPTESFGMHRCRLLAEGIVDAWLSGRQDEHARTLAVESRFAREGLSLDRPHLSAGSDDVYEPLEGWAPSDPGAQEITAATVASRLARYGLSSREGARVIELTSRNRNFLVLGAGEEGYFVKQLRVPGAESFAMMEREATLYRLVHEEPRLAPLRERMPAFHGFEPESRALFLGAPRGAESLAAVHHRERAFPPALARAAGEVLATLHAAADSLVRERLSRALSPSGPPGIFTAHRGGPLLRWLGPGQRALVERIHGLPRLATGLDDLARTFRPEALIHGDIKWENLLARPSRGRWEVTLVDWELCDLGDGAWDTGCLIQSYVTYWALSGPLRPGLSLRDRASVSAVPLPAVAEAARAVWEGYRAGRDRDETALLERTLRCTAARVLQSALEVMHGRPEPTPAAIVLLEIASEAMNRPDALAELLGLAGGSAR